MSAMNLSERYIDMDLYQREGFALLRGLFSSDEAAAYKAHFMDLWSQGKGFFEPEASTATESDPLKKYPRMIHMHRWDALSLKWMLDERICQCLTALLGTEPYAAQTMFYFKPPGARGQALHQDQAPLKVQPGTCMAAWMAIDPCDEENGCLQAVPGTHQISLVCPVGADTTQSFTNSAVPLPEGLEPVSIIMEPGDVFFFNGQVIHGSYPNRSDRFRRALIGHYIAAEAEKVGEFYHPILRFDGSEVEIGANPGGEPCGVWAAENGQHVVSPSPKQVDRDLSKIMMAVA